MWRARSCTPLSNDWLLTEHQPAEQPEEAGGRSVSDSEWGGRQRPGGEKRWGESQKGHHWCKKFIFSLFLHYCIHICSNWWCLLIKTVKNHTVPLGGDNIHVNDISAESENIFVRLKTVIKQSFFIDIVYSFLGYESFQHMVSVYWWHHQDEVKQTENG